MDPFTKAIRSMSPANRAEAVTPSDSTNLTNPASALYIGGAGNVVVITTGGDTVTFNSLAAGSILPLRVARVKSTNTTATNIVALWQS